MPIILTKEQEDFIAAHQNERVEFVDPRSGQKFVLLTREEYDTLRRHNEALADRLEQDAGAQASAGRPRS